VGKAPGPPTDPAGELDPAEIDQRAAAADRGDVTQMLVLERHRRFVSGEPSPDHPRGVASRLLRRIANAGDRLWQNRGVANDEHVRMARNAEVRLDLHAAGTIRLGVQPLRGR